jgi:hypothetical protein
LTESLPAARFGAGDEPEAGVPLVSWPLVALLLAFAMTMVGGGLLLVRLWPGEVLYPLSLWQTAATRLSLSRPAWRGGAKGRNASHEPPPADPPVLQGMVWAWRVREARASAARRAAGLRFRSEPR